MTSMQPETVSIETAKLSRLARQALLSLGLIPSDADTVLAVLMYAQQRGSSQGLIKIVEKTIVPARDAGPIETTHSLPGVIHLNANGQAGMVALTRATELAIEAAPRTGIAAVVCKGTASSTGAIGYYANRLADAGLIGIVLAGSPATTAVHGGIDPVMGTNPITIAIPGRQESVVFDMATAATTVFSLIAARDNQQAISPDMAWDANGNATTDPEAALQGAIRTFGEAKGSGLGLMFELLTVALSGGALPGDADDNRGNLLIAIDPAATVGREVFKNRADSVLTNVLNSRPVDPGVPVRLPGTSAARRAQQANASGQTRISRDVWARLQSMAGDTE